MCVLCSTMRRRVHSMLFCACAPCACRAVARCDVVDSCLAPSFFTFTVLVSYAYSSLRRHSCAPTHPPTTPLRPLRSTAPRATNHPARLPSGVDVVRGMLARLAGDVPLRHRCSPGLQPQREQAALQ